MKSLKNCTCIFDGERHMPYCLINSPNAKIKQPKFEAFEEYMDWLSTETGLTRNGGEDSRLFAETIFTKSKDMNKGQYEAMEDDINSYSIMGEGFEVYAWNDSSGYSYWTLRQKEDNYIQVTVKIQSTNVNAKEVSEAARKAYDYFLRYARYR